MKILSNKHIAHKGVQLKEDNKDITTLYLIDAVLTNYPYRNSSEVLKASKILGKLKDEDGSLNLEDDDYVFIKQRVSDYKPLVEQGVVFAEFFEQFGESA